MGTQIGMFKSETLPPGLHIPPNAATLLIEQGWRPPQTQDPPGSFLLPEGGLMSIERTDHLTRNEADIVVRQLVGRYYDDRGIDNTEIEEPGALEGDTAFRNFARRLAYQIIGLDTRDFRDYLVDALRAFEGIVAVEQNDQPHDLQDRYEEALNLAVNGALDAADLDGSWIIRSEPVTI